MTNLTGDEEYISPNEFKDVYEQASVNRKPDNLSSYKEKRIILLILLTPLDRPHKALNPVR